MNASIREIGAGAVILLLSGCILSPKDETPGSRWFDRKSGTSEHLNAVAWNGERLVAVGAGGTVLTSSTGTSWTARSSGVTSRLNSVTWAGTQFVAVGEGGTVLTSPDGASWTTRDAETTASLHSVTWTGETLVAVGAGGAPEHLAVMLSSQNGVEWEPFASETASDFSSIDFVMWAGGKFIATAFGSGGVRILVSSDGEAWSSFPGFTMGLNSGAWTGQVFVVAGEGGIMTSLDASTWDYPSVQHAPFRSVAWSGRRMVAVGRNSAVFRSPDGLSWAPGQLEKVTVHFNGITWTGKRFVAVGSDGHIFTSP